MIQFTIATPERVVYKDEIDSISLPTPMGEITVLQNHIPLVSLVSPGAITLRKNNAESYISVSGGFVNVKEHSNVTLLADTAEKAEELTLEAVEKAREAARLALTQVRVADDATFARATAAVERELARMKVARKHRAKGGMHLEKGE